MDEVYVYAGNLLTGEVCSVIVENDDDLIYDAAERFNESFDYAPMVWARRTIRRICHRPCVLKAEGFSSFNSLTSFSPPFLSGRGFCMFSLAPPF